MAQKTILTTLSAAVATNGTFAVAYPAGFTANSFAAYGHSIWSRGHQKQYKQDDGKISVSFGATTATFTYKGSTTLPANSIVDCELHIAGSLDDTVLRGINRLYRANVYRVDIGSPAVKASNNICLSQSVTAAALALLNGTLAVAGVIVMDVPRAIQMAWTTTSVATITGKDEYGVTVVESSASGTSHTGKKAFATITSITFSISVTSMTAGTLDVLGLPIFVDKVARIIAEYKDGVAIAAYNDKVNLFGSFADVSAPDSVFFASPVAGRITSVRIVLHGAITGADSIVTAKINNVAVTGLSITVANAASANGVNFSGTPTGANVVAVGDKIEIITDGASSTTAIAGIQVEITTTGAVDGTFTAGDQTVATATTGDVRGTYLPKLAADGSGYSLLISQPDPIYLGSAQFGG